MRYVNLAILAFVLGPTAAQAQNLTLPVVSLRALQAPVDVSRSAAAPLPYGIRPLYAGRSASVSRYHHLTH